MRNSNMTHNSLANSYLPRAQGSALAQLALIALGVVLLAVSSKVQVPFWPVPMTLQTAVVLLIGASYGARLAGATLASYIAAGAAGLPVFAKGAGLAYMAGPTGGYLAGFFLAAVVMGWLSDKGFGRTIVAALGLMLIGQVLIFGFGVAWLAILIGAEKAVAGGLVSFIPAEVLKTALAAALLGAGWSFANKR
jgi:biotin transport system substrate-specific component